MKNNKTFQTIATIIIALITWFALGLQLYLTVQTTTLTGFSTFKTITNYLSYFTILSNILVALTLTISLTGPGSFFSKTTVRSAVAVYIFIVLLVYNLVLRGIWQPQGWQLLADNLLHVAVPALYIAWWRFFTPRYVLYWKDMLPWFLFPAFYLVYSLLRGPVANWYPYPFLDVPKHGFGRVTLNAFFVILAFVLVSLSIIAINRSGKRPVNVK
jgi:hypothetical protein